ncbi:MAG: choice-of-anchor L domain-containing protein [Bacteroidetes bacterium]|nr:choice-of-anchor L domain-containing protein [Bacteroidota bacterium]
MKKFIFTSTIIFSFFFSFSQTTSVDFRVYKPQQQGAYTLQNILQNLVGDGVVLKNFSVSKTWSDEAFGYFEDGKSRLGMKKGLLITTGGITGLCGKNTKPDMSNYTHRTADPNYRTVGGVPTVSSPDLEKFLGNNQKTFDAVVIEMDIVPTADSLSFNYVFGSEEYDEFVGTAYNDVFAFFISGKGVEGQVNLAVVPNTSDPVSVNSINNGGKGLNVRPNHPTYYVSNIDGNLGIEYDGVTKLMEIKKAVTPYETYHLKLAIADVGDNAYDSGVLIEGHSIVSYEKSYSVLYDKNTSSISEPYKNLLNALVKEYKTKTDSKISVTGHTDNEGEMDFNKELSCKRANEVKEYLMNKGVPEGRLIVDCKGETQPVYDNKSDEGKHMNRRVELKLLGNEAKYNSEKKNETIAEEKSQLINNTPNPFLGQTTINASILNAVKDARLIISDLQGKQVKEIFVLERGNASVGFDAANLSSGIYLATLVCDGQACGAIKMILEK